MKYIIIEGAGIVPHPIIFSSSIDHKDEANGRKVISAGFIKIDQNKIVCDGWSRSLGIDSRPDEDAKIISIFFKMSA